MQHHAKILNTLTSDDFSALTDSELDEILRLADTVARARTERAKRIVEKERLARAQEIAAQAEVHRILKEKMGALENNEQYSELRFLADMHNYAERKGRTLDTQKLQAKIQGILDSEGLNDPRVFAHLCYLAAQ